MGLGAGLVFAAGFTFALMALWALIWAIRMNQFGVGKSGARTIFGEGEIGTPEDPSATVSQREKLWQASSSELSEQTSIDREDLENRIRSDNSSKKVASWFIASSIFWLIFGSIIGVVVSLKFTLPNWLTDHEILTFGRLRPIHLNSVIYGWSAMAGIGIALWMLPRLLKTTLRGARVALLGCVLWNIGVAAGLIALLFGWTDGMEWLEFPWPIDIIIAVAGAMVGIPLFLTFEARNVKHSYVSVWYLGAALVWFPMLFFLANVPYFFRGVEQSIVNWWFAHNVLGLWLTPLGLSAAYYFIPKVVGKPIFAYDLSLIGFWGLAFFYSQVGAHHLIGGPIPTWVATLSIVMSVGMFVPVIAVAVNHHFTMKGHFKMLRYSPTLRFIVIGAIIYTLVSFQGSLTALRTVNHLTHFTHYTVAHAHLGVYGFVSFVFFGALYFILPRVSNFEWPFPKLIALHFWLVLIGFAIYYIGLTWGGILQGIAMVDESREFADSVLVTIPYLWSRSVGGSLMTLGHLVFGFHAFAIFRHWGPKRHSPAYFFKPTNKSRETT